MSEVTKYRFSLDDGFSELSLAGLLTIPAEGEYVRAEDYAELEARIAELEAEVARLRKRGGINIGEGNTIGKITGNIILGGPHRPTEGNP